MSGATMALVGVLMAVVTLLVLASDATGDWATFVDANKHLWGDYGLELYVNIPLVQTGPIHLVVVGWLEALGPVGLPLGVASAAFVSVIGTSMLRPDPAVHHAKFVVGGVIFALWVPFLKQYGHVDDAWVLALAVVALVLVQRDRRLAAAVVLGLAVAVKPWIVFMLPITVRRDEVRSRRVLRPLVGVAVAAVFWGPFFLASTRTFAALRPTVALTPDSILTMLGFHDADIGTWLRMAQLGLAMVVVAVAVWHGRPAAALLGGVAVRLMFDPATWNYYTAGLVLGALVWDVAVSSSRVPWATMAATVLVPPMWLLPWPTVSAWMRAVACLAAVAVVIMPPRRPVAVPSEDDHYRQPPWSSRPSTRRETPSVDTSSPTASSVATSH